MKKTLIIINFSLNAVAFVINLMTFCVMISCNGYDYLLDIFSFSLILFPLAELTLFCIFFKKTRGALAVFGLIFNILIFISGVASIILAFMLSGYDVNGKYYNDGYWGTLPNFILAIIYFPISLGLLVKTINEKNANIKIIQNIQKPFIEPASMKPNSSDFQEFDPVAKLRELKELYDEGIIDESIYLEKRKKYIDKL